MSDKRYEANIIRATAVEPANNLESTSAPGVWSIDEVVELQKKSKWPTVGNVATNVDSLFSTFLYDGTSADLSINNGINLSGEGGLVWFKDRNYANNHRLYDTARGVRKYLDSSSTAVEATNTGSGNSNGISAFNSNGFTIGNDGYINDSSSEYVSWTFRKKAKFFDVVTYTGNGVAGRTVAHNLGAVPGMIILKNLSSGSEGWRVYHRGANGGTNPEQYYAMLQATNAFAAASTPWNNTAPTSTEFTLGTDTGSNGNGNSFVAYLFAHNNNDGGFGPDQDGDIIKCGYYTGDGADDGPTVDLGFEPQFILSKHSNSSSQWNIVDTQRGLVTGGSDVRLYPNLTNADDAFDFIEVTPTGFKITTSASAYNTNNGTYIYMAIRRPQAAPTAATQVFHVNNYSGNSNSNVYNTGFNVDMNIDAKTGGSSKYVVSRLTNKYLDTNSTAADNTLPSIVFGSKSNVIDLSTGWWGTTNDVISYSWKRARGYFDVVAYNPTSTSTQTITHNLGVKPEMVWIKQREAVSGINRDWAVGMPDILGINNNTLSLNNNYANGTLNYNMFTQQPTATQFVLHGNENGISSNGGKYIAYLFATVAGVSKVGSVAHSGSSTDVDCGFSSGAKFVMLKRTDDTGDWFFWDTVRGIASGNDPYLLLNTTAAQVTNTDYIDPLSSGFQITGDFTDGTYIFYAIA